MVKKYSLALKLPLGAAVCVAALLCGCNRSTIRPEKSYPAGSTVEVGKLIYSVSNPQWSGSLEGEQGPRMPTHKFLVLTVSVTSKNSEAATMPLLTIVDGSGQSYLELDKGEGLTNWLGLFRKIEPNGSEGGSVVFDVPSGKGPYKLRVSSGGDVEKEITALIEVPDEKASPSGGLPAPEGGQ